MDVDHFAGAVNASGDQWFEGRTVDLDVDQRGKRDDPHLFTISFVGDGHTAIS